jgi:prefoldin alpha subunit
MTKEDEISRNLTLIEYYKEELKSIELQIQYMQAAISDFHKAKLTIEQIKNAKSNSEILIPIGGGNFLNGVLTENSKILVDIGAGLVSEKTGEGAINKIEERIKKLHDNYEKLLSIAQQIENDTSELSQKTQKMMDSQE